jgi:hypothetical protein
MRLPLISGGSAVALMGSEPSESSFGGYKIPGDSVLWQMFHPHSINGKGSASRARPNNGCVLRRLGRSRTDNIVRVSWSVSGTLFVRMIVTRFPADRATIMNLTGTEAMASERLSGTSGTVRRPSQCYRGA